MEENGKKGECCDPKHGKKYPHYKSPCGGIYFFAMIGAAVYYIQQVHGFWPVVLAILKAIVWPAFLLYRVFQLLHL